MFLISEIIQVYLQKMWVIDKCIDLQVQFEYSISVASQKLFDWA